MTAPLRPIGAVAEETGLTLRTLRFYEEKGLIAPLRKRSPQGARHRLYSEADIARLLEIAELTAAGLSLREVGLYLRAGPPARRALLCKVVDGNREAATRALAAADRCATILSRLEQDAEAAA